MVNRLTPSGSPVAAPVPSADRIVAVDAATVRAHLPEPLSFGDWVIRFREFVVVRVRAESGLEGFGFTLTRDGPVADAARQAVAPRYVGGEYADPESLFVTAQRSNLATLSAGVGLRALSIVDLATWDLFGRQQERSIARLLGGTPQPMPATAIVGYPPQIGPEELAHQVREAYDAGWRRFKMAMAATHELTRARLNAATQVADDITVGLDAAWTFCDVESAVAFGRSLEVRLSWYEDVIAPGDAGAVAALRQALDIPIAMGDEQGGLYYPEALLAADAVDVVRLDLTCMGGISRARSIIDQVTAAGRAFAPHMFAHVHSQVLAGLGHVDVPVEWGVPWTGVDPYADSLRQPVIQDGLMEPLPEEPGFGELLNRAWLADQELDDPDGVLA